jgi:hypothetical protein
MNLHEAQRRYEAAKKSLVRPGVNDPEGSVAVLTDVIAIADKQEKGWGRLKLEAMRTLGEYLVRTPRRSKGRVNVGFRHLPTLTDLGITDRHIAADALKVAAVSDETFRAYIDSVGESFHGLLRFVSTEEPYRGIPGTYLSTNARWRGKPMLRVGNVGDAVAIDPETTSTEWLTPKEIFDALAVEFEVDVCSPGRRFTPWIPATTFYTKRDDGLKQLWRGFVWLNPPYGKRNNVMAWIEKFVSHGDGVALVPDFTSTEWWQYLTGNADAILFTKPKVQFLPRSGEGGGNALGSTLVAIGKKGVQALRNAECNGRGICFYRRRIGIAPRLALVAAAD